MHLYAWSPARNGPVLRIIRRTRVIHVGFLCAGLGMMTFTHEPDDPPTIRYVQRPSVDRCPHLSKPQDAIAMVGIYNHPVLDTVSLPGSKEQPRSRSKLSIYPRS